MPHVCKDPCPTSTPHVPLNQACAAHSPARSYSAEPVWHGRILHSMKLFFSTHRKCSLWMWACFSHCIGCTYDSVSKDSGTNSQCISYLILLILFTLFLWSTPETLHLQDALTSGNKVEPSFSCTVHCPALWTVRFLTEVSARAAVGPGQPAHPARFPPHPRPPLSVSLLEDPLYEHHCLFFQLLHYFVAIFRKLTTSSKGYCSVVKCFTLHVQALPTTHIIIMPGVVMHIYNPSTQ